MRVKLGVVNALCIAVAAALVAPASGAETPAVRHARALAPSGHARPSQSRATTSGAVAPAKATSGSGDEPATLGTIVVTATRRSETLQKVPLPVSVLSFHDIQRQHLQSFADYAAAVPGLVANSEGPGLTELTIRGISSGSSDSNATVGIYVDNTPYGSSAVVGGGGVLVSALQTPDIDPADLERIEVLKGPQGTLYGAGALGGVVRFITIPPDTQYYAGRLQVGGSSVSGGGNGFGMHGMVNLPLVTGKLALRANLYNRLDPGFVDDAGLGKTNVNKSRVRGGRVSLLWTPTAKTSVRVNVLAQNLNAGGLPTVALDPDTGAPLYGDLQQRHAADTSALRARYRLYNITFKTDLGWAKLMSSTSYNELNSVINIDETTALFPGFQPNGRPDSLIGPNVIHETQATEELRLTSPKSEHIEWLGGLFFSHQIANPNQFFYTADYYTGKRAPSPISGPDGFVTYVLNPGSYKAYAAYANVTWHVTPKFDLEGGVRDSHDKQRFKEMGDGLLLGVSVPTVIVDQGSSDSTVTYSLTPSFHFNDTTMVYARVATGFLPGGPNNLTVLVPGIPKTFAPTKLTDYELGLKSTAFEHRLLLDMSVYHIDWKKIPLTTFINPDSFLTNGGRAKSDGADVTVAVRPLRGLTFSVNAAYNNARLTKDAPPPSNGKKGDVLPYAPHFTLSLSGDYDFSLGGNWRGYVGASYRHLGKRAINFAGDPSVARTFIPHYDTLDLRAGVSRGEWDIAAYIKNVTNRRGIVLGANLGTVLNPATGKMEENVTVITPRLLGVSVSRSF